MDIEECGNGGYLCDGGGKGEREKEIHVWMERERESKQNYMYSNEYPCSFFSSNFSFDCVSN